jgi:hypothetical protein
VHPPPMQLVTYKQEDDRGHGEGKVVRVFIEVVDHLAPQRHQRHHQTEDWSEVKRTTGSLHEGGSPEPSVARGRCVHIHTHPLQSERGKELQRDERQLQDPRDQQVHCHDHRAALATSASLLAQ